LLAERSAKGTVDQAEDLLGEVLFGGVLQAVRVLLGDDLVRGEDLAKDGVDDRLGREIGNYNSINYYLK